MKDKHIEAYMSCAEAFAKCSSAKRLKVGTVIVKSNRIISCGYNAQPEHISAPVEDRVFLEGGGAWMDEKDILEQYPYEGYREGSMIKDRYKLVTSPTCRHSEKNALLGLVKSSESAVGATLFCTHSCCLMCSIDIVDSGISAVYYKEEYRDRAGIDYLEKNGVKVIQYKGE